VGKTVLDFVNSDIFYCSLDTTHIVLILKTPSRVTDYWLISLCNVLYKLMANVLANRMKEVLNFIMFPNQSVFLLGRLIFDNVIVAFKALHSMNT
jgi:hypothetical protein